MFSNRQRESTSQGSRRLRLTAADAASDGGAGIIVGASRVRWQVGTVHGTRG